MGATVAPAAAVANFPHSPPFPSSLFDELFLKEEEGGGGRGEGEGEAATGGGDNVDVNNLFKSLEQKMGHGGKRQQRQS